MFCSIGKKLGDLHVNYEKADLFKVKIDKNKIKNKNYFKIEKMKFAGKRPNLNKSTIIYNEEIKIDGIPLEAYKFVINRKSAIEWVMESLQISKDPNSEIINNANNFAIENMKKSFLLFRIATKNNYSFN